MKKWFTAMALLSFSAGALAQDAGTAAPKPSAATEALWKNKCMGCHGETGRADTKTGEKEHIGDLGSAECQAKMTDADLRKIIEDGSPKNPKMRPYKGRLTPEQIGDLVAFIRSLKR